MKKNILLFLLSLCFTFSYSQVRIGTMTSSGGEYWAVDGLTGPATSGSTSVGQYSTYSNSGFTGGTYIGYGAGYDGSSTTYSTAVGYYAMYGSSSTSGDENVAVGASALRSLTSGSYNTTVGNFSGRYNSSGNYNAYLGAYAGYYNYTGVYNTFAGYGAGYNSSGSYNTAMGTQALGNQGSAGNNTAIGYRAGYDVTSGTNNTLIGDTADVSTGTASNQIAIGYAADAQANNSVTLGNSDVTAVYMAEDSGATVYAAGLNLGGTALTSTGAELNILDGVTATATELNYVDGVTSNVQTQLDSKQATITGAATTITSSNLTTFRALTSNGSGKVAVSAVTSTELGYLDGVTSAVQTQLDSKQATITGAATTITSSDLTASRAVVSNGSGKVEVSAVTSTELGYLDGVTSAIQTQLDSKLSSSGNVTFGGNLVIPDAGFIGSASDTDAMTIAANGNTTFSQDVTVSGDVTISSDARLKSNITSLGATLSKLLLIDGKSYTMNKSGKEKIGILAQDVQKVFPELVIEGSDEMLSVNYQGLVPVLINAIKEQEDKISRLENLVEKLISEK